VSLLIQNPGGHSAGSAADFGKVAVLLGGDSSEREISLISGNGVLAGLKRRGVDAHAFDLLHRPIQELVSDKFDRAWNILHGPGGEDGLVQGALEWLGVPYTGSGVLASALTMDKLKTKRVVAGAGLTAPPYLVLENPEDLSRAVAQLDARAIDPIVFAERFIDGGEYTVSILQERALPSIRIEPATEFYDYQAKYFRDDTKYHCPSGLGAAAEGVLRDAALATFRVTECFGWGRVDFMRDEASGKFYFIEINTTPGMTSHSLVPMAARQAGMEFDELVWRVLETSFSRVRK
jgi:D-alanine-D-alanine ligase